MSVHRIQASVLLLACGLLSQLAGGQEPPMTALAFSPKGDYLVTGSQQGVQVLDWPDLTPAKTVASSPMNRYSIVFSPSGERFAVAGGYPAQRGTVSIYSWPDGESLAELEGHEDTVQSIVWLGDSNIVSGGMDRAIRVWDLHQKPETARELKGHSRSVDSMCLLADGKTLVSTGEDQSLRVWNLDIAELIRSLNQHTKPVHALALRPAMEGLPMVVSASRDRTLRFWQPTIGRMVRYIRLESEPLAVAWLDAGHIVASCTDGRIRVVDTEELEVVSTESGVDGWAYCVAVHPAENKIVVGGSRGQLRKLTIELEGEK